MQNKPFITFAAAAFALPAFLISFSGTGYHGFLPVQTTAAGNTAPESAISAGTSLNWAGYTATGGTFTSVGASWTVPESATPSQDSNSLSADATWVGIGGISSKDLIQAGTQTVFQDGTPSYQAWYEVLPADSQQVPLTVHPGDAMTVSIAQQSAGQWEISFADNTTGQSYNTSVTYQSSLSSADWIEEMPSASRGFVALDNFGSASFTNGSAIENGVQVDLSAANAQPLTMINSANQALATPSALGADGASFTITRTSVAASTASLAPSGEAGGYGYGGGGNGGRGRWTRTGVGVQGYAPTVRISRGGAEGGRFSFGNLPSFFRTFRNGFRDGWNQ